MRPRPRPVVARPIPDLSPDLLLALRGRAERDARGLFLAEGARFLIAALDHGAPFAGIAVCPHLLRGCALREDVVRVERAGVPLIRLSPKAYARASPGTPDGAAAGQGAILVLRQAWEPLPKPADADLWIGVETVRSGGNLGTLLRSGHAAGATGLVVFDRCEGGTETGADPHDPSAVRATMGSLFAHRLVRTTHRAFRRWARGRVAAFGATAEGAVDYRLADYRRPALLMLGDERKGLSEGQRATCGTLVRIPMLGAADSLNLAMAGTILLYEAHNQRNPA